MKQRPTSWKAPTWLAPAIAIAILWTAHPVGAQQGPMDFFITFSRSALEGQRFVRHAAEIGGHETVWWEQGTGETLVLVHGVNDQAGSWFQVAASLAASYHPCALDPRLARILARGLPQPVHRLGGGREGRRATHRSRRSAFPSDHVLSRSRAVADAGAPRDGDPSPDDRRGGPAMGDVAGRGGRG